MGLAFLILGAVHIRGKRATKRVLVSTSAAGYDLNNCTYFDFGLVDSGVCIIIHESSLRTELPFRLHQLKENSLGRNNPRA
jgi:hypothetical protein